MFAVLLFFSGITVWSFDMGLSPIAPNRWLGLFVCLVLPLLGSGQLQTVARSPLMVWVSIYLFGTGAWFIFGTPLPAGVVQTQYRLFAATFVMMALVVFADPRTHVPARRAIVGCVLVNVVLNIYDLTHPLAFSPDIGRAAGLYVNANISGVALLVGVLLGFGVLQGFKRHAFVVVGGIGIATTQSRSAALAFALALLLLVMGRELRAARLAVILVGAAALSVAGLALTGQLSALSDLVSSGLLLQQTRLVSISGAANEGDFYSTQQRIDVARNAWETFTRYPLFGGGLGASGYTHNMYLMHAADHGVSGLLIFPGFVLAAFMPFRGAERRTLFAAAAALLIWGLFSHNVLEEMHTLLAAALASSLLRTRADERNVSGVRRDASS